MAPGWVCTPKPHSTPKPHTPRDGVSSPTVRVLPRGRAQPRCEQPAAAARHLSSTVRSHRHPGCWVTGQKKPAGGPRLFLQISCHPRSGDSSGHATGVPRGFVGSVPLRGLWLRGEGALGGLRGATSPLYPGGPYSGKTLGFFGSIVLQQGAGAGHRVVSLPHRSLNPLGKRDGGAGRGRRSCPPPTPCALPSVPQPTTS